MSQIRYLTRNKTSSWTFDPPSDIKEAGITKRRTFKDGRTAQAFANRMNARIDAYRKGETTVDNLPATCTFLQLTASYLASAHVQSLSGSTVEAYTSSLSNINGYIGTKRVHTYSAKESTALYNTWVKDHGAAWANKHKRIFGVLLSYAESIDIVPRNPMTKVATAKHEPRSNIWTKDQVETALEFCFSDFKYRSLGVIILLCYEWGQRPVDIQNLKWDNLDFETNTATIKQKKRGATVILPIDEDLREILLQQKEDYDFQDYVAPFLRKSDSAYRPHTASSMSPLFREVLSETGLPDHIRVGDLRKTAITEMRDAGLEGSAMMSVTGHQNISSLNPYLVNTRKSAESALTKRKRK